MAHPLWPLFDLRLRSERVELRLPTDADVGGAWRSGRGRRSRSKGSRPAAACSDWTP